MQVRPRLISLVAFVIFSMLLVACAPQTELVEVTRIVTEVREVEVTRLLEVEVTRVVGVPLEVTRLVETDRVVTQTPPRPTSTPRSPEFGTSTNPYPMGMTATLRYPDAMDFEFTVLEVIRGEEAWQLVSDANRFSVEPGPEEEYIMVKGAVEYTGDDEGMLQLKEGQLGIVIDGRVFDLFMVERACCLEPRFDFELLPGAYAEGVFAWIVPVDPDAMLKVGDVFFELADSSEANLVNEVSSSEVNESESSDQLDLEDFTDVWVFGDEGVTITYVFLDDSTFQLITRIGLELEGSEPLERVIEGTWEYQGGTSVCTTINEGSRTCFDWHLEGDTLRRGEEDSVFVRQP